VKRILYSLHILLLPIFLVLCDNSLAQDIPVPSDQAISSDGLVVTYRLDSAPIQFRNAAGEPDGILIDVWRLWAEKSGIPVRFVGGYSQQTQEMVREGKADINAGLFSNQRRAEFLDFSAPILSSPYHLYFNDQIKDLTSIDDLTRFRVGVTQGSFHEDFLREHFPNVEPVLFEGYGALFDAAEREEITTFITQPLYLAHYLTKKGIANHYRFLDPPLYTRAYQAAVKDGHAGLLEIINRHMAQITTPERRAITRKWLGLQWADNRVQPLELSADEKQWLAAHEKMRLGIDPDWPPFEFIDGQGQYRGIGADFIALINNMLGIHMTPIPGLDWATVVEQARKREIDILPAASATAERKEFLSFTKPYFVYPYVIFVHEETQFVTSLTDLAGKRVAVESANATADLLRRNHPDIELVSYPDTSQALFALHRGEISAYVGNLSAAAWVLDKLGMNDIKVAAPTPYNFEQSIGVRKDWPQLVSILNRAIDQITPQQRQAIKDRWFAVRFEHISAVDARAIWRAVVFTIMFALPVLGLILWWNRRLQREIRRRKEIEAALRTSEDRYEQAMAAVQESVWEWSMETGERYFSPRLFHDLGYGDEEVPITNQAWVALIHPQDRDAREQALAEYEADPRRRETPLVLDYRVRRRDGGYAMVRAEGLATSRDSSGRTLRRVGTLRDVTALKAAEEQLRESEAQLKTILNTIPLSIVVVSLDGVILMANPHAEQEVESAGNPMVGRKMQEFYLDSTERESIMRELSERGQVRNRTIAFRTDSGKVLEGLLSVMLIKMGKQTVSLGILVNLTERMQMERDLAAARDQAEQANRSKSEFLANMSHELRTPLNSIIGFTGILKDGIVGPVNEEQAKQLGMVYGAARHLLELINDILDLSKVEAGRVDVVTERFQLAPLLEELQALMQPLADAKGLVLQREGDCPDSLVTDRGKLRQVLVNLLGNAIKFTEFGSVTVFCRQTDGIVVIEITDTGVGIAETDQERIFNTFDQVDTGVGREYEGTGLGLAICRRFVEMLGGEIEVACSAPGEGSTFRIRLPGTVVSAGVPSLPNHNPVPHSI
jgi:polar amino acid transport system substrate-binding protein